MISKWDIEKEVYLHNASFCGTLKYIDDSIALVKGKNGGYRTVNPGDLFRVDCGEGYRFLEKDERIENGDEYFYGGKWNRSSNYSLKYGGVQSNYPYRRKVWTPKPGDIVRIKNDIKHFYFTKEMNYLNNRIVKLIQTNESDEKICPIITSKTNLAIKSNSLVATFQNGRWFILPEWCEEVDTKWIPSCYRLVTNPEEVLQPGCVLCTKNSFDGATVVNSKMCVMDVTDVMYILSPKGNNQ